MLIMTRIIFCVMSCEFLMISAASFINEMKMGSDHSPVSGIGDFCSTIALEQRIDCYPDAGSNQTLCMARGCCWSQPSRVKYTQAPWCFYPSNFPTYSIVNVTHIGSSYSFDAVRTVQSFRPNDIMVLNGTMQFYKCGLTRLRVCEVVSNLIFSSIFEYINLSPALFQFFFHSSTLFFQLTDPNNARFEVPLEIALPPSENSNSPLKMEIGPSGNLQVVDSRTGNLR